MSEHDDLLSYRRDTDFPASSRFTEREKSGLVLGGFRCPYCPEHYAPGGSSGSYNESSELLAARMKQSSHARQCRGYRRILEDRKKLATDPVYAREMEIKFLVETGHEDEIPKEWAEDLKRFWRIYERK